MVIIEYKSIFWRMLLKENADYLIEAGLDCELPDTWSKREFVCGLALFIKKKTIVKG